MENELNSIPNQFCEMQKCEDENQIIKNRLLSPNRRLCVDNKYAINHIGHKKWDIISKNMGSDIEIWRSLYEVNKRNTSNMMSNLISDSNKTKTCCGEDVYLSVRQKLIPKNIIIKKETNIINKTTKSNNKSNIKGKGRGKNCISKADKIKKENIEKKINSEISSLIDTITSNPIISSRQIFFNEKMVELTLIRLMIQCRNLIEKFNNYNKKLVSEKRSLNSRETQKRVINLTAKVDLYYRELIELIVGYNKIVNEKKHNEQLSKTCLSDLVDWISEAKKTVNFDPSQVIMEHPNLIFKTVYDGMLNEKQTKLYKSQEDLFNFVINNNKFLALVHTMLGSGKTSMILPICAWLLSNKGRNRPKLIFCCPNEVVLLEVARMIYGMAVPFGIVIYDQKTNKLDYKWSSFVDTRGNREKDSAILYLCDMFSTRILLEERMTHVTERESYLKANQRDPINYPLIEKRIPNVPDYILMADELTKDADSQIGFMVDSKFSVTTELFISIMKIAPPKIILMSATLPTSEQLSEFYRAITSNHPGMIVKSFVSSEARIGCALISKKGELYSPHSDLKTVTEIRSVLSVIKSNPFIGRFYTFEILLNMIKRFESLSIPVPDLRIMFDDPTKANQTNIQNLALSLLEQLSQIGSDDMVDKACSMNNKDTPQIKGVDLGKILTDDIHRFNKGCLVFSTNPIQTAYTVYQANFDNYLSKNIDKNIFEQVRIDIILDKYERESVLFNKSLNRIENKLDDGSIKRNKVGNKKERIKTESWQKISEIKDSSPIWAFPKELQLCSYEHLKKTNQDSSIGVSNTISPEDLPKNTCVAPEILTMLASGVGIYTTESDLLDDDYLKTVIQLAKRGLIKMIFTDSSIAYGTNLAVSDIIMIDESSIVNGERVESIVDKHSIKTIFQMLGRAGRGGNLSYEARIYTVSDNNNLIETIKSYIKGTLSEGTRNEVDNIRKAFEILW